MSILEQFFFNVLILSAPENTLIFQQFMISISVRIIFTGKFKQDGFR